MSVSPAEHKQQESVAHTVEQRHQKIPKFPLSRIKPHECRALQRRAVTIVRKTSHGGEANRGCCVAPPHYERFGILHVVGAGPRSASCSAVLKRSPCFLDRISRRVARLSQLTTYRPCCRAPSGAHFGVFAGGTFHLHARHSFSHFCAFRALRLFDGGYEIANCVDGGNRVFLVELLFEARVDARFGFDLDANTKPSTRSAPAAPMALACQSRRT